MRDYPVGHRHDIGCRADAGLVALEKAVPVVRTSNIIAGENYLLERGGDVGPQRSGEQVGAVAVPGD